MSIRPSLTVWCDEKGCGCWAMFQTDSKTEARIQAAQHGWETKRTTRGSRRSWKQIEICPCCAGKCPPFHCDNYVTYKRHQEEKP